MISYSQYAGYTLFYPFSWLYSSHPYFHWPYKRGSAQQAQPHKVSCRRPLMAAVKPAEGIMSVVTSPLPLLFSIQLHLRHVFSNLFSRSLLQACFLHLRVITVIVFSHLRWRCSRHQVRQRKPAWILCS